VTKILYFAWLREKIGAAEDNLALPPDIATVANLIDWLQTRGPGYADANPSAAPWTRNSPAPKAPLPAPAKSPSSRRSPADDSAHSGGGN
jgi:hypothetical protein